MPITRDSALRLRRLRAARQKVAALAKPALQRRISAHVKRLDRRRAWLQQRVKNGQISARDAKRSLAIMTKVGRELTRAAAAHRVIPARALAAIDRDIKRAERKG